jgi:hypothetical protein
LLEPSVSVAHGGLGIHCQSVALPRPAPAPVSRRLVTSHGWFEGADYGRVLGT